MSCGELSVRINKIKGKYTCIDCEDFEWGLKIYIVNSYINGSFKPYYSKEHPLRIRAVVEKFEGYARETESMVTAKMFFGFLDMCNIDYEVVESVQMIVM